MKDMLIAGDDAPYWSLQDQHENSIALRTYLGNKIVVMAFHPLAWTSVCAAQMKDLENNKEILDDLNAIALGFSVDSVPCKHAWAKSLGIKKTSLMSDFWPHGEVAQLYGVFNNELGFSNRSVFVITPNGKIGFSKRYAVEHLPDINEILAHVKSLSQQVTV